MKTENATNKSVKAIPEGFHTVTPFIVADNAAQFISFLTKAFDAKLLYQMKIEETNKISHATIKIGDSIVMISDVSDKMNVSPCMLYLYVEDVDSVYKKALNAKGTSIREPLTEFYGDRSAGVKDAWGNQWWIATHVEDVSEEELKIRKDQFIHQHTQA